MPSAVTGIAFGRYRLIEKIGVGGMAQVWKALLVGAHDFSRVIVIKRILAELGADPEFKKMFTREALLSARLHHPNIVQVFEFSSVDDQLYLAMEFVDGLNLVDFLRGTRKSSLPIGFVVQVVHEICRALAYVHALTDDDGRPLRLIHRDVTPSNVMVTRDGVVKLLDFGIAKALGTTDDMTRTGSLRGKLGYLSPELVEGEVEIDQRADVFAAGIVLHELLTGRRLFKAADELKTLSLVRACRVDAPSTLRPDVPEALDRICMTALSRDRDARYADAGAMAAELGDMAHALGWSQGETERFIGKTLEHRQRSDAEEPAMAASPAEQVRPSHRARSRRRWPWLVGAALLVTTLGLGLVVTHRPRSPVFVAPVAVPVASPPPAVAPVPEPKVSPPPKSASHGLKRRDAVPHIKNVSRGELVDPF